MRKRILLVDDNPMSLLQLERALTKNHFEVDATNDAGMVVSLLSHQDYDLIISDVMMPDLDGFDLVKVIKQLGFSTPILFISSTSDELVELKAKNLSGKPLVIKTPDMRQLIDTAMQCTN